MSFCGECDSAVIVPWKDGYLLNFEMFIKLKKRTHKYNYLVKLQFKPLIIFCACLICCFVSVACLS
jgi:hypothetical protein